MSKRFRT